MNDLAKASGFDRRRHTGKCALYESEGLAVATAAFMEPNEQAQRLEVVRVGGDGPLRVPERGVVGTESLVAQPENVERVRILADVLDEFLETTDSRAVVLEPECVRRPAFQPRGA